MGERATTIRGYKYIRLKSGRLVTYHECTDAAGSAWTDMVRAVSRSIKLASGDDDLERIEWFLDNVDSYAQSARKYVQDKRGVHTKRERIALLRNVEGRTPEEAAEFLSKADELEQHLP